MVWDLETFKQLCDSKSLPDSRVYQKALYGKNIKALILVEKLVEIQKIFWNTYPSFMITDSQANKAFSKMLIESEIYMEAAIQNIHSMADILCQIINVVLLNSTLHEAKVDLNSVILKLDSMSKHNVKNALENLRNSDEFKYIAAFSNTIKHRRLMDTDYHAKLGGGTANTHGLRFIEFTYDKPSKPSERYDSVLDTTIIENYIPKIRDLIESVGQEIENSL